MSLGTLAPALPALRRWPRSLLYVGLLLSISVVLFGYGLAGTELWRTETLRALIAREMLDSGNWIVPRLYGEPLFTKPPGMYVAIVLCSLPFGQVTEVTARLPSALAATGSVLLFFWYFRRTLGRTAGLIAAVILPLSVLWLDKTPSAEIDSLQVFWVLAAIVLFLRATETEAGSFGWTLASLLCMAGGVLTKWTAPEFFYGTVIPFLWWHGRLRWLIGWRHLTCAALAAGLCLGWVAAAVWLEGWHTFWNTFEREAFSRLVPGYSERPYPVLAVVLHPLKLFGAMLPWSAIALVTLRRGFLELWDEPGRRLLIALHCWTWPQVVFWSLITEHTPRHSFPLYPGVAGLAAMVWYAWATGRVRGPRVAPLSVLAGALSLWLIAKIVFVHTVLPARTVHRYTGAKAALLNALVPDGQLLYLFRIKDEGLMFYYGRPAVRLHEADALPGLAYCVLPLAEWQAWPASCPAEVVQRLTDAQGAPIVVIRGLPGRV